MAITPLKITDSTTLLDLQRFADAAGKSANIRGRTDAQGNIELYVKSNGLTRPFQGLSKGAKEHQALARAAIGRVFDNTERTVGEAVGGSVRNALAAAGKGELKRTMLNTLATAAMPSTTRTGAQPTLEGFGDLDTAMTTMADFLGTSGSDATSHDLTANLVKGALVNGFNAKQPPATQEMRQDLALANTGRLKDELVTTLEGKLQGATNPPSRAELEQIVATGVDKAVAALSPARIDAGGLSIGSGTPLPQQPGSARGGYGEVTFFGTGQNATAAKFALTDKPGQPAVNPRDRERAYKAFDAEIQAHAKAASTNHPNILGFKGTIKGPEGQIGIAMESAPNGDLGKIHTKLLAMPLSPKSQMTASLSLALGVTRGMAEMHDLGMLHGDAKAENVLIGTDGRPKLMDFGLSSTLPRFDAVMFAGKNGVPEFLSPETNRAAERMLTTYDDVSGYQEEFVPNVHRRGDDQAALNKMTGQLQKLGGLSGEDQANMSTRLTSNVARSRDMRTLDMQKSDSWGVGLIMSKALFGKIPFQSAADLNAHAAANPSVPVVPNSLPSTGNAALDSLINDMFAADPANRPSLAQIEQRLLGLNLPIDTDQARQLVVAAAQGNTNTCTALSATIDTM